MGGLDDLNKLDEQFRAAEPARAGGGDYTPIPEDTRCKLVVSNQRPAIVGAKQTACCKVTFEVVEPAEYAGRKVWHDFWLTEANLKYLKRDMVHLGWLNPDGSVPPGKRLTQLLQETDASLMGCGAEVTVGVEVYNARDPQTGAEVPRTKNTIKYFNGPYRYTPPGGAAPAAATAPPAARQPAPAPTAVPEADDEGIPF